MSKLPSITISGEDFLTLRHEVDQALKCRALGRDEAADAYLKTVWALLNGRRFK